MGVPMVGEDRSGARSDASAGSAGSPSRRPRRTRWILPALLLLAWLVLAGVAGPATGKLSQVQENDVASYLPESAESTQVIEEQAAFQPDDTIPAILVWTSGDPLTGDQHGQVAGQVSEVAALDGVVAATPPEMSEDGLAAVSVVSLSGDLDQEQAAELVADIRHVVADSTAMSAHVTGTAGVLADFAEVFAGIDGVLLLVALVVVLVILLVVYRSPILPFVVLLGALFALGVASALVYLLAKQDVITLNGQSQGILFILVVGATTDYSLLLVSRYREELRRHEDAYRAMRIALRASIEPILASGGTVILGVLCLLASDLNANRSLGPVAALGIVGALLAALTYLPAALTLLGRRAYWPVHPDYGTSHPERGLWASVARLVGRRPRQVWILTALVLGGFAMFSTQYEADGMPQSEAFTEDTDSGLGAAALAEHFPAGSGQPVVIITNAEALPRVIDTVSQTEGVAVAYPVTDPPGVPGAPPHVVDGRVQVEAVLEYPPDSSQAQDVVADLRVGLDSVDGADAIVGGSTAIDYDIRAATQRDLRVIIPLVLVVTLVVLSLLLRSLAAPVLLVASVVLSFAATIGVSALVFFHLLGMAGSDPAVPLYAFVFLVSLGIDYNIFLMTRIREESIHRGTRSGILTGLAVTGGVITSAGLVLAATFGALVVLPLVFLVQIAFIVAFGVLLDTFVVRSFLVPALAYDIGPKVWWASRLSRAQQPPGPPAVFGGHAEVPARQEPSRIGAEAVAEVTRE